MTRTEILAILRRDNPGARPDDLAMYADCFANYREAADNISRNGTVVTHPRTGSPIDNPYCKVQAQAMSQLLKLGESVDNVAALWL